MSNKNSKRILSVTIKRMVDDSPDTSWLGEYASKPNSGFSIDRAHSEDCASVKPRANVVEGMKWLERLLSRVEDMEMENSDVVDTMDTLNVCLNELEECDCGERGDMEHGQYRYFNPGSVESFDPKASWLTSSTETERKAEWLACMRSNAKKDYERMESLNRGDFCFIGIKAEADVVLSVCKDSSHLLTQTIRSGGLWGIESDSDDSFLEETEKDELSQLRTELKSLGFSSRAISTAFKTIERKDQ